MNPQARSAPLSGDDWVARQVRSPEPSNGLAKWERRPFARIELFLGQRPLRSRCASFLGHCRRSEWGFRESLGHLAKSALVSFVSISRAWLTSQRLEIGPKRSYRFPLPSDRRSHVLRQVNPQTVSLLIGDDLRVRPSFLVESGVRPPQNGEVDPIQS